MNSSIQIISLSHLAISIIPVGVVIYILYHWSLDYKYPLYAILRMLVQLLLIGYFLVYIFDATCAWPILLVLMIMVLTSSWIALGTIKQKRKILYLKTLVSLCIGGGFVLILITQGVLEITPWYLPRYMIPLAGMIFANSMNSISLAAERLISELEQNKSYENARQIALKASLIPMTNSLFAVGLVSLPGMMTGQILSGISPFVAARYQIMVMCMIYGASGIAAACFLVLVRKDIDLHNHQNN